MAGKFFSDITKGLNMKFKAISILLFIIISSLGISKPIKEKNVTFIVTGNVRTEFNLCG